MHINIFHALVLLYLHYISLFFIFVCNFLIDMDNMDLACLFQKNCIYYNNIFKK
ncbi:hypothetical protein Cst_c24640 [Thermoclostridium stercorarium subsp. stercorarium DSM 8532]|uniref:Uncharacterized protein n=1 Tax=Thermoclostridium stercorarium (strain ATCC 35414 / DSM 8532 / NCIMB 11754) TaxID=1121335 RepID=L7VRZ6_THES1|nr:hypothetical protein Cst_c24640 [Thermoclostridium stercorarium subsp. stercorarium DSM 8532]